MFIASLIALDGPPGCVEGLEPHPWLAQALDKAMVLFNPVVEVLVLS